MKPTPDQELGITLLGRSLLISAAAGSGKTAVLARRCAYIVCQSERQGRERCGIENLLVVTFTRAAAQQMRDRIAQRLAAELACEEAGNDEDAVKRLRREIALLPRASISTLSSFCADLVRRHFQAAGVDPDFAVLDEDQAFLLKRQSARAILDEQYAAGDQGFLELVDLYADGYDERLIEKLIACHALGTSLADPAGWRKMSVQRVTEAAGRPLAQSELGSDLLGLIEQETLELLREAKRLHGEAAVLGLHKYAEHIEDHLLCPAAEWASFAVENDLGQLSASVRGYRETKPASMPGVKADERTPEQLQLASEVRAWKALVRQRDAGALLRFSEADWIESLKRVIAPTEQFLRLAELFDREYARAKSDIRALDFADLERTALRLLLREPQRPGDLVPSDIALYYQRHFHHVLVDEFQDINEVQDHLLRLLSRECAPEELRAGWQNNLFAVGDVKQSIYRFRLAMPDMFKARARRAKEGGDGFRKIDLQMNFRSREPLLAAINAVFWRLLTDEKVLDIDYADAHELAPNPEYPAADSSGFAGAPVELLVLEPPGTASEDDREDDEADDADGAEAEAPARESIEDVREAERIEREAAVVARRIKAFLAEGRHVLNEGSKLEPLSYRHIAVLLRSRKFNSERFANLLRRSGVPCFSEIGTGFFASLEVRDIVSLLHVLDNRRQDVPLAAVLRSPLVDLPEAEDVLARVRLEFAYKDVPFFEAVLRYARKMDDAIAARLRFVLDQLDSWRKLAHRRPVADLLWHVYTESGYLAYVAGLHDGEQRTANLLELHRRAGQFDAFARQGLGAFMQFLESLEKAGEVGQPPTLSEADDVVRVMSIHAAKGLEFPVVFLADCGKAHNLSDAYGSILLDRRRGLAMQAVDRARQVRYGSVVHELAKRDIRRASIAEELRILYVAMTRAREHLVCVGTAAKDAQADLARWQRDQSSDPLHPSEVLKGRSYLEWLGRAVAKRPEHFDVRVIAAGDIDPEAARFGGRGKRPTVPAELAELRSLENPPLPDEATIAVIARLSSPYRFMDVAQLPAAVGVTSLSHGEPLSEESGDVAGAAVAARDRAAADAARHRAQAASSLRPPAFLDDAKIPAATDLGTATHVVLRLLDFRAAASESAVREQIGDMIARRQLDPRLAGHVDVASIAWLAASNLGRLLAEHHDKLLRELPVRVPAPPAIVRRDWGSESEGPMDRVLLRGQIDVAVPLASGLILADYKTDRLEGIDAAPGSPHRAKADAALLDTVAAYRAQIAHYRRALEQVTGRQVTAAYLVLLRARRVERL